MASSSSAMLTREELARKRTLDEARKSGVLPPKVDDEGNMLNPHMPEFMSQAPWYLKQDEGSGLKHQRLAKDHEEKTALDAWYKRGKNVFVNDKKTRFEKNACKNCGAKTHTAKDCMERPRKRGAWKTNTNLASDEVQQQDLKLDYDAARDRWNGFDADAHMKQQMRIHERAEQEKRKEAQRRRDEEFRKKQERKAKRMADREARKKRSRAEKELKATGGEDADNEQDDDDAGSESDSSSGSSSSSSDNDDDDDDDGEGGEGSDAGGRGSGSDDDGLRQRGDESAIFKVGNKVKASVHNLRIREDTAKYLRNLNPDSAFYDPKTRSMRANPNPELALNEAEYAGDNYVKMSGDAIELAKAQTFAWDYERRAEGAHQDADQMHLQGNPTQILLAQKQFEERAKKAKELREQALKEKYGEGALATRKTDPSVHGGASSEFVEYTPDGRRIRSGVNAVQAGPKYEEDVMEGNHTSVWGSYFDREGMRWGFQCCWQTSRRSYCTGEAGKRAKEAARKHAQHGPEQTLAKATPASSAAAGADPVNVKNADKTNATTSDSEDSSDENRGGKAARKRRVSADPQSRGTDPTEAEMDAYHRQRARDGDPMQ
ncbi:Pre-mRNA-splicing factor Slu7 [Hondaea fermentalgiana]|uniref:Pre-mRNA-splicing factor SLU7 n=1 Tax=Hondaea fermentalgiana TaxID=2315210 RepID=A0A2R5G2U7_9STRA|nr:Pre-mRNA-splicing factor Slu7 [Hondaea fermentalgiana]|eukprot:GBG25356.1 Pre-mRNA-splicing factor Slu7 [Hondaea fermentalgiana]